MLPLGHPLADDFHVAVAEFALQLLEEVNEITLPVDTRVVLRIGIHSGQVVAGVIGTDKFTYDLWGDTVNTASRMESTGVPGSIQVSAATYRLIRHRYHCTPRGTVAVKGKGDLETFILVGHS